MNFHGSYVDVVGATNLQDRFYDTNNQLDVSVSQKIDANMRVYVDALNLNDALLRYYQGVPIACCRRSTTAGGWTSA